MPHLFTSLRHSVEKLLEAEHFLGRLLTSEGLRFQFELNAFLSASRGVTLILQKAMSTVPGFAPWYDGEQAKMRADASMDFFRSLRNVSQKEGPIAIVAASDPHGGWTYRFVDDAVEVPADLKGRDVRVCCAAHLAKLASLLLECERAFPFHCCPARAFSEEGKAALGYSWRDVEIAIGLPPGYTAAAKIPTAEKLRILRREIEPLDTASIQRISQRDFRADGAPLDFPASHGTSLADDLVSTMERYGAAGRHPREIFLRAVLKRHSRDGNPLSD